MSSPSFTAHFSALAPAYDVLLCDVWGVVHNGVAATVPSCDALIRYRAAGGTVVLLTNAPRPGEFVKTFIDKLGARRDAYGGTVVLIPNAPRPGEFVKTFIDKLGVPRDAYDGIVSSGDVTRTEVAARAGQRVFPIGPERDLPIFE